MLLGDQWVKVQMTEDEGEKKVSGSILDDKLGHSTGSESFF